ncbi:MAG: bifunctional lysylphosphatidylglycerol flippase/synthetase MprF [Rhodospirillaceae bacterium]|nr:MAG: bifunctional lysylphosphatidylglycerol flippase/synthetase MprF [Rhodospirillaceae bacterium]
MTELEDRPAKLSDAWFSRWWPLASRFLVPLLAIGLFALAIWTIHHSIATIRFSQIRHEIGAIPARTLLIACGLTMSSFLALALQDYVALCSTGKRISFRRAALGSYIAQSVAHSTGFSIFIGGALRARYYMAEGLTFADTMKVHLSFSATFGMATCILLGLSFVLDPSLAETQMSMIPQWLVRTVGVVLLAGPAAVFIWRMVHVGPLRLFGRQIDMPDTRHLLPQTMLSLVDVACMGAVLYVFLPAGLHISYPTLIGLFAVAMTIGVTSHVPGGLGVFEATMLLLIQPAPAVLPALVSGLVMFRFVYYFLPLVFGGVAVAIAEVTRHRGRLRELTESVAQYGSSSAPLVFGLLTFLAGAVTLASEALPSSGWRLAWVSGYFPHAAIETAHVLVAIIGAALLLLGRGLSRRLVSAWWLTEILLALGAALALVKGLEYEVAALLALLCIALLPCKSEFYRTARLVDQRFTGGWIIAILLVVLGMGWLLTFIYRHLDYNQVALMQFELRRDAPRSLRAVVATLATLAMIALWHGITLLQRPTPDKAVDFRRIRSIVGNAPRAAAHLALTGDKRFLFGPDDNSFIMYGRHGRSWIAIGDPVGPRSAWTDLIWDFRDQADRHRGEVAFFDIRPDCLPIYLDLGLQVTEIGERARVSLDGFAEEALAPDLRAAHADMMARGAVCEIHPADAVDQIMGDLAAISDAWLELREAKERHATLGFFSRDYIARCPVAVLRLDGRIVAFANLWCGGDEECSVDLLRYAPAVPASAMPTLLIEVMSWAKERGYRWFDLGMAPLPVQPDHHLSPLWGRLDRHAVHHGYNLPDWQALRDFKQSFSPVWETAYLAYPMRKLPATLIDIAALITGGRGRSET